MRSPTVFISYRRSDSPELTGRLRDRLVSVLGRDSVFTDFDSIAPGVDFRSQIESTIRRCHVVLAVIGRGWFEQRPGSDKPRLTDPDDYVRIEIETALDAGVPIIPVLVGDTTMPLLTDLPDSIRELGHRNAARLRSDPDFHIDVDRLLKSDLLRSASRRRAPTIGVAMLLGSVALVAVSVLLISRDDNTPIVDARSGDSTIEAAAGSQTSEASNPAQTATVHATDNESTGNDSTSIALTAPVKWTAPYVWQSKLDLYGFAYLPTDEITATASSVSKPDPSEIDRGIDYEASNMVDGTLETAWQEGLEGLGIGSQLEFHFEFATQFEIVEIFPGWQTAHPCIYRRHARPSAIRVEAFGWTPDSQQPVVETALTGPAEPGAARSVLRAQIPFENIYDRVTLTVTDIEPGEPCGGNDPFDDMLISEVQFAIWSLCAEHGTAVRDVTLDVEDLEGYVIEPTRLGMPGNELPPESGC